MSRRINENDLEYKVAKFIKNNELINKGDKIVLAVSGGPDSLCMLNLFCYFKEKKIFDYEFVVAHINHMIREEAEQDAEFVKQFCMQRNIEFFCENSILYFQEKFAILLLSRLTIKIINR